MSKRIYSSRRQYTAEPTSKPYMELSEVCTYAHRNRIWFSDAGDGRVELWSCGHKLCMPFKRGVHKNEAHILARLKAHDWRVCPTYRHAFEWVYYPSLDRHVCLLCAAIGA